VCEEFKWETFEDPSYIHDLALSDYLLFLHFKKFFGRPESEERTNKGRCAGVAESCSCCTCAVIFKATTWKIGLTWLSIFCSKVLLLLSRTFVFLGQSTSSSMLLPENIVVYFKGIPWTKSIKSVKPDYSSKPR